MKASKPKDKQVSYKTFAQQIISLLKSLIDKQKQTHGKLSCFVDFGKAFDTLPHGLLWQVLRP